MEEKNRKQYNNIGRVKCLVINRVSVIHTEMNEQTATLNNIMG